MSRVLVCDLRVEKDKKKLFPPDFAIFPLRHAPPVPRRPPALRLPVTVQALPRDGLLQRRRA
eukprot:1604641-Prymnesium_polylepis.1